MIIFPILTFTILGTMAFGGCFQDDTKPADSTPSPSIQALPATTDAALEAVLPRLQAKCGPGVTREQLRRMSIKGHEILAEHGLPDTAASVASHVADSIPTNYHPGAKSNEVFAAYLTLRTNHKRHSR